MTNWIPSDQELPSNPRCVLATDGEAHFIAVYEGEGVLNDAEWSEAYTGDEIIWVITHWMELPEVPE